MKAKILQKIEKTEIVLEAESEIEEKQLGKIWELKEKIILASICRIGEPSPRPGLFLTFNIKDDGE